MWRVRSTPTCSGSSPGSGGPCGRCAASTRSRPTVTSSWRRSRATHVGRHVTHDIAGRFFAAEEVTDLRGLPPADQQRVFFDYWTLKEAYIKARGFGLALPLGDFAFKLNPPGPPAIAFAPSLDDDPSTWQFMQDWPTPQHRLGLAVRRDGADLPVRLRFVTP